MKGSKRFFWDDKCEKALRSLKEYLSKLLLLSKPVEGEPLYLYLAVTEYEISGALVWEENKVQWLVYYISKQLVDAETRYLEMEKLALALMIATRKLRPYFHSHPTRVLTNYCPPKARCFRSTIKMGNRAEPVSDQVSTSTSNKGTSLGGFHH